MKRVLVIGSDSASICAAMAERFFEDNEIAFIAADDDLKNLGMGVTEWQHIDGVIRVKHIPVEEVIELQVDFAHRPAPAAYTGQVMDQFFYDELTPNWTKKERKRAQWKQEVQRGRRR